MRMILGIKDALPELVDAKFSSAKASSSLLFSHTELSVIRTSSGIPFQLRYCPALAKKPEPQKHSPRSETHQSPKAKFDPFENPSPALLIAEIPAQNPSHVLVLNKFPVIPSHFIIATKANKPQTGALEQDDLEATYACLKAWRAGGDPRPGAGHGARERLFAFFNSGEHSGASQPHRHLQFLPVESMRGDGSEGWELLVDLILEASAGLGDDPASVTAHHPSLPFAHFACRLPTDPSGHQLFSTYNALFERARKAVDEHRAANPGKLPHERKEDGQVPFSYNLAMTTEGMAILPRRSEGDVLKRPDGTDVGFVALNGTALGGTLMVKFQEEFDILRSDPRRLDSILEAIGIPKARLEREHL